MKKLAIISSHPIQYNAPWFALLSASKQVVVKVFYTWGSAVLENKYDPGFGKEVAWDIPLLEGYEYTFVKNTSSAPGSHHFKGIINPSLNKEIEAWHADAVLVFGWAFVSHLKCMRYFHKKIPVLFRGDSTLLREQSGIKNSLRWIFLTWVYRHVSHALYVGTENKRYFKKYGLKDKQLVFAPHAIDNSRFLNGDDGYEKSASDWKASLGIKGGELTILFAGKLEPIKNPGLIIEFAKKFASQPVKFIIAGNGPLEKQLKLGVAGNSRFIFIAFQNQQKMPVVYRLGDLFILPSKSETWGLSINEAMACGRGVLVRDTCGCAVDLVEDNVNGYIFNESNMDGLFAHVTELINGPEKVRQMGEESIQKIAAYSFQHIVAAIESVLT